MNGQLKSAFQLSGIRNISGVSCHLNSAIQLFFHALSSDSTTSWVRLTHEYCDGPNMNPSDDELYHATLFVYKFGSLLDLYLGQSSNCRLENPINPQVFYDYISNKIDPDECGDAGTALTILLDTIRKSLNTIVLVGERKYQQLASSLLNELTQDFWKGKIVHQIRGIQYQVLGNTLYNGTIMKQVKKVTKNRPIQERTLPCPWILPTRHETKSLSSLNASIQYILSEQAIQGYQWGIEQEGISISECIIDVTESDDDSSDNSSDNSSETSSSEETTEFMASHFKTFKYSGLDPNSLPRNILVRLKRFEYKDQHVHIVSDSMDIPKILDLRCYISPSLIDSMNPSFNWRYGIKGAIVYVNDVETRNYPEMGHYVTYVSLEKSQSDIISFQPCPHWVLLDDDKIVSLDHIDEERIIHLLSGRLCNFECSSTDRIPAGFATILLFQKH